MDSSIGFSLRKNYMLLILLHFISIGDFFIKANQPEYELDPKIFFDN